MPEVERVSPKYVWDKIQSGTATLLVCAYDDAEKCNKVKLAGSTDLRSLKKRLPEIETTREIIFFCS